MDLSNQANRHSSIDVVGFVSEIVAAYLGNNSVPLSELPAAIKSVHAVILSFINEESALGLSEGGSQARGSVQSSANSTSVPNPAPSITINDSINPGYIVCLEDGEKFKTLKRHLKAQHNLTPEQYKARWSLPADYPMVASLYAAHRSLIAKEVGLGHAKKVSLLRRRRGRKVDPK